MRHACLRFKLPAFLDDISERGIGALPWAVGLSLHNVDIWLRHGVLGSWHDDERLGKCWGGLGLSKDCCWTYQSRRKTLFIECRRVANSHVKWRFASMSNPFWKGILTILFSRGWRQHLIRTWRDVAYIPIDVSPGNVVFEAFDGKICALSLHRPVSCHELAANCGKHHDEVWRWPSVDEGWLRPSSQHWSWSLHNWR